jgi:hypothetical protein
MIDLLNDSFGFLDGIANNIDLQRVLLSIFELGKFWSGQKAGTNPQSSLTTFVHHREISGCEIAEKREENTITLFYKH